LGECRFSGVNTALNCLVFCTHFQRSSRPTKRATGSGTSRTILWPAAVCNPNPPVPETEDDDAIPAGIIGQTWHLLLNDVKVGEGPITRRVAVNNPAATDFTFELVTDTDPITVSVIGGTAGGGTPGPTHRAGLFATDVDMAGGSWSNLPMYGGGTVAREWIVGAPILVVEGDDFGLWTVTASGPCTPGPGMGLGDTIVASGAGWEAVAVTADGESVAGFVVQATGAQVAALATTVAGHTSTLSDLDDAFQAQGTTLDGVGNDVETINLVADADAVAGDLRDHAAVATPPTAWAVCGEQDATIGDACYFRCTTTLPSPTATLEVRATARFRSFKADSPFAEIWSEPKDAAGMPGAGGVWDRYEVAFWPINDGGPLARLWLFWEYTESGGSIEQWLSETTENPDAILSPAFGSSGAALPANTWVTVMVAMDLAAGTTTLRVRTDTAWDFEAADETRWRTLRTYTTDAEVTSLAASDDVEQWIGRGGGRFDVARVQVWLDDVAAMDFDPSTADDEATEVADSVLLDDADDPAVWTANDNAVDHDGRGRVGDDPQLGRCGSDGGEGHVDACPGRERRRGPCDAEALEAERAGRAGRADLDVRSAARGGHPDDGLDPVLDAVHGREGQAGDVGERRAGGGVGDRQGRGPQGRADLPAGGVELGGEVGGEARDLGLCDGGRGVDVCVDDRAVRDVR